jgi:hypothetical protein
MLHPVADVPVDFERRFGGLRRLLGHAGAQAVFDSHVVVVWAASALGLPRRWPAPGSDD